MRVTALKLHDEDYGDQWSAEVEDRWEYADFVVFFEHNLVLHSVIHRAAAD